MLQSHICTTGVGSTSLHHVFATCPTYTHVQPLHQDSVHHTSSTKAPPGSR